MENLISNSNQFYFFQDNDKERVMHSKSYDKEIMINYRADKVIKILLNRQQNNLEKLMKSIELVFNDVNLWYIIKKCEKWWIIYRFV